MWIRDRKSLEIFNWAENDTCIRELNPEPLKEDIFSDPTQPKKKKAKKEKKDREVEDNVPLLAPEDQEKADGIILLLAFCAQGRAAAIETINQRLIPLSFAVEYCVRMIRKNKSFEPWLLFIAESYFNTESTTHPAVFSVQYSANFWFILEVSNARVISHVALTNFNSTFSTCWNILSRPQQSCAASPRCSSNSIWTDILSCKKQPLNNGC